MPCWSEIKQHIAWHDILALQICIELTHAEVTMTTWMRTGANAVQTWITRNEQHDARAQASL